MSKRTISDLLNDNGPSSVHTAITQSNPESSRSRTKPRLDDRSQNTTASEILLSYPNLLQTTTKQTPFQQPTQILSFSYTPSRELEFTDSALRYFVEPPLGAKLNHGYEQWIRRPEQRGRIDGLVQAFSKAKGEDSSGLLQDIGVISWRGVMTRYVGCVLRWSPGS